MPVPQIITVHNLTTNSIFISDLTQDFEIKPGATVTATNYDDPEEVQSSSELESAYRNGLVEVFLNAVPITSWPFLVPPGGGVTSFETRTGAVTSAAGDYTAAEIDYDDTVLPAYGATDVQDAIDAIKLIPPTVVTAAGDYTVMSSDRIVLINKTVGEATGVDLPPATGSGRVIDFKDAKGDADTNNITLSADSQTVDGAVNLVLSTAYAAVRLYDGGSGTWFILA